MSWENQIAEVRQLNQELSYKLTNCHDPYQLAILIREFATNVAVIKYKIDHTIYELEHLDIDATFHRDLTVEELAEFGDF